MYAAGDGGKLTCWHRLPDGNLLNRKKTGILELVIFSAQLPLACLVAYGLFFQVDVPYFLIRLSACPSWSARYTLARLYTRYRAVFFPIQGCIRPGAMLYSSRFRLVSYKSRHFWTFQQG